MAASKQASVIFEGWANKLSISILWRIEKIIKISKMVMLTSIRKYLTNVIYLFKFNNVSTGIMCKICSKLTTKSTERRHWRCSGNFIVNFEQISHIGFVFPLFGLNK